MGSNEGWDINIDWLLIEPTRRWMAYHRERERKPLIEILSPRQTMSPCCCYSFRLSDWMSIEKRFQRNWFCSSFRSLSEWVIQLKSFDLRGSNSTTTQLTLSLGLGLVLFSFAHWRWRSIPIGSSLHQSNRQGSKTLTNLPPYLVRFGTRAWRSSNRRGEGKPIDSFVQIFCILRIVLNRYSSKSIVRIRDEQRWIRWYGVSFLSVTNDVTTSSVLLHHHRCVKFF